MSRYTKMSAGNGKDPEFAKNDAEQIDIKRLPPKIQKVLDKYDVDGDGTITAAEFVIAMEQHEATKDSLAKQKKMYFGCFSWWYQPLWYSSVCLLGLFTRRSSTPRRQKWTQVRYIRHRVTISPLGRRVCGMKRCRRRTLVTQYCMTSRR